MGNYGLREKEKEKEITIYFPTIPWPSLSPLSLTHFIFLKAHPQMKRNKNCNELIYFHPHL